MEHKSRRALLPGYQLLIHMSLISWISSTIAGLGSAQTAIPSQVPSPIIPIPPTLPDLAPEETPAPLLLPSPEDLLELSPSTPILPEVRSGTIPGAITVQRFEVVGSTVFSPETLARVTAPFTQRPIAFAELLQARSAVTKLYTDQGYSTSGAFIPPQRFQGGVVKIQVVEGGLEAINVSGTQRLNRSYVRNRLKRATSKPLNVPRLLEALQLLQLNPLIKTLSAELSAGLNPGTSLLEVRVTEAQSFRPQLVFDNNRSPSVGSFQRGIQLTEANLLGLGDSLGLGYINTEGSNELNASYTLPLNASNGTLGLNYGMTRSHVTEPPFDRLDIDGNLRDYNLTFRQPLIQTPTREFALGLTAARRESDTSLLGIPFPLSLGADLQGRTRVSALRFFQEWTQRGTQSVLAARSQLSLGLGAFDATINETDPDSRFLAWRGQVQLVRLLAPETLLLLRSDVQLATSGLVPLEQFSLGGQESVRGYRQDALFSDNGAFASAEFRFPIYRAPSQQSVLQLAPFIDFGTAWNTSERANLDTNTLVSIGLGLRWQLGDQLTARLDWGLPLVSIPSSERTWQENGFYFSVGYSPF